MEESDNGSQNIRNAKAGRHTLIAGTGRCGTSVLVKSFHLCGLSTSIGRSDDHFFDDIHAGHELPCNIDDMPYIIKSPLAYEWLSKSGSHLFLRSLDYVIIPIRRYSETASSRLVNEYKSLYSARDTDVHHNYGDWQESPPVSLAITPGGYHFSLNPIDQSRFLAACSMELLHRLAANGISPLFLPYPEFCLNPNIAAKQLKPFLKLNQIKSSQLVDAIYSICEHNLIHSYADDDDERREIMMAVRRITDLENNIITFTEASHRALYRLYRNSSITNSDKQCQVTSGQQDPNDAP